jgi:hypothetical protein
MAYPRPKINETTKRTRKTNTRIFAILAEVPAMPPESEDCGNDRDDEEQ